MSPFLKNGNITLIFHSGGSSSSPPAFRYFVGIPSDPGHLLFLSRFIARVTSWYVGCTVIPSAAQLLAVEWNTGRDFDVPIEQIIEIFYPELCDVSWISYQISVFHSYF